MAGPEQPGQPGRLEHLEQPGQPGRSEQLERLGQPGQPRRLGQLERPGQPRRRGRQAEAERNDQRVLEAAREVFGALGPDAPVSAVADRAGVGMGSLYRRFGSKDDLLRHLCTLAMQQTIEAAATGLADPDAWAGLAGYVRACVEFGSGALGALAGTIETTPQMWEISRRGRDLLEKLVGRARREGGLRGDVTALDIAWLIELFGRHGPGWPGGDEGIVRERLLAIALDGLRAPGTGALPGPAPSRDQYERRWLHQTQPTTAGQNEAEPPTGDQNEIC